MKRDEIIDLRFLAAAVQPMERTDAKCILFCISEDKEYAELVLENVTDFKNEELLGHNTILFVKAGPSGKNGRNRYTFFYRETRRTTVILAETMGLYRSGHFIGAVGRYAAEEWKKRHICLPSLMTAILILETDNGRKTAGDIRELVKEHTDYLAARKSLWGQANYILAAQYLQEADRPYFADKKYEKLLIQTIEENELTRFDL